MKNKSINKLVTYYYKLKSKFNQQEKVINIFDAFNSARSLLIVMPIKAEEFVIAHRYVDLLLQSFTNSTFTFIIPSINKNLLTMDGKYGTIFVDLSDVSWFGLPKKELVSKMNASSYDIAIDLNYSFNLLSTLLCHKSDALLRICMKHEHRESFFNINISLPIYKSLDDKYQSYVKYINASAKSTKTK